MNEVSEHLPQGYEPIRGEAAGQIVVDEVVGDFEKQGTEAVTMMRRAEALNKITTETGCTLEEAQAVLSEVERSHQPKQPVKLPEPDVLYESKARIETRVSIQNMTGDVRRNDKCPCGSGKKFKKCCLPGQPRLTREVKKQKYIIDDPEVAKALAKHQKAGKIVRMVKQ